MLSHRIIEDKGIVVVEPDGSLSAEDFEKLSAAVDTYLATHEAVRGLLIHAEKFPGWDSFAGLAAHIHFVCNHQRKVGRVAIATDSALGTLAESLGKHFVSAEVRHFAYANYDDAMAWLEGKETLSEPVVVL